MHEGCPLAKDYAGKNSSMQSRVCDFIIISELSKLQEHATFAGSVCTHATLAGSVTAATVVLGNCCNSCTGLTICTSISERPTFICKVGCHYLVKALHWTDFNNCLLFTRPAPMQCSGLATQDNREAKPLLRCSTGLSTLQEDSHSRCILLTTSTKSLSSI